MLQEVHRLHQNKRSAHDHMCKEWNTFSSHLEVELARVLAQASERFKNYNCVDDHAATHRQMEALSTSKCKIESNNRMFKIFAHRSSDIDEQTTKPTRVTCLEFQLRLEEGKPQGPDTFSGEEKEEKKRVLVETTTTQD